MNQPDQRGKIRVMIVEDSAVVRQLLEYVISQDPRLKVAAAVSSGEEALKILYDLSPDVISLDIRLPGINGFELTQRIMSEKPTPIVVVSASVEKEDLKISMSALRAGALTVLEKPVGSNHAQHQAWAERLCTQLAIMSQVKVIRQRFGRTNPAFRQSSESRPALAVDIAAAKGPFTLLGVVASTGGPNALVQLFNGLGSDFPLPICLVQHITTSFLGGFVDWLSTVCPFKAVLAQNQEVPAPGRIYLAPADYHLCINGFRIHLDRSDPVSGQRPSGTVLFESMARALGKRALCVLLTGMGDDGARGLGEIRKAGGYTLAEDQSTAVVYGMPAAAVRLGAVLESLPLPQLAPRIRALVRAGQRVGL